MFDLIAKVMEANVWSQEEEKERLGFLWRRGEEEKEKEKETSEEEKGLEPSLYTHKGIKIMKFPICPYVKLQDITFFPPYKNSSSNFTSKEKE